MGAAQRRENGNTIVWFGADVNPTTRVVKSPQTYTLVEADANPEAGAVAVLDVQIPPGTGFPYRALPVETLFGELPGVRAPLEDELQSLGCGTYPPTLSCQLTVSQWNWYLTVKINPEAQVLGVGDGTQFMTVQQYLQARKDAGL